jgi:hypothetical protein
LVPAIKAEENVDLLLDIESTALYNLVRRRKNLHKNYYYFRVLVTYLRLHEKKIFGIVDSKSNGIGALAFIHSRNKIRARRRMSDRESINRHLF